MGSSRMQIFIGMMIIGLLSFTSVSYGSNRIETEKTVGQRALFLHAEAALEQGNARQYSLLASQLKDYPLYPWLVYRSLAKRIQTLPRKEILEFLKQYGNTSLAPLLYEQWLFELAHQQQWSEFASSYRPRTSSRLQCLYLQSLLSSGAREQAFAEIPKYWLSGQTSPRECEPVFKIWQQANGLNAGLVWERFSLALGKKNLTLARQLLALLPKAQQSQAAYFLTVYQSPQRLTAHGVLARYQDHQDLLPSTFARLAHGKPLAAESLWPSLQKQFTFYPIQQQALAEALISGLITTHPERANAWFEKIGSVSLSKNLHEWQIRYLLKQNRWAEAEAAIHRLPQEQQNEPIWRYWFARSLQEQGREAEAMEMFKSLAALHNYYGFLASSQLNSVYKLANTSYTVSPEEYQAMAKLPGIARAREWYALRRYDKAKQEWRLTVNKMSPRQRYIAARIAKDMGWASIAMTTTTTLKTQNDDLGLLYPRPYKESVLAAASRHQLSPSLLFALIRQESLFQADVTSFAGARGLMQLMPSTAKLMANQLNIALPHSKMLYQPSTNIRLGSAYFDRLLSLYEQNPILAIASYNAGPGRVKKWLPGKRGMAADIWVETIPWKETREYVKFVVTYALIYDYIAGAKPSMLGFSEQIPARA